MEKKKTKKGKRKGGRPKLKEEEKLKHFIGIKINDDDLEKLESYIIKSKEDQSSVIREILFKGKLTVIEKNEDTQKIVIKQCEVLDQLKRVGVNLNQIAEQLNSIKGAKEVEEFLPTIAVSLKDIDEAFQSIYKVNNQISGKW